jgi:ATP-dependent protease ClpP protease subunit
MKLIEACSLGWAGGCETVGEAIDMVMDGAAMFFNLQYVRDEIAELEEEARKYDYYNTKIEDIYPEEVKKWDEDLKHFMETGNFMEAEDIDF